MLDNTGYGPLPRRRGSGNMFTHAGQFRHPGHRDDPRESGGLGRPDRRSVITAVNGQAIGSPDDLAGVLARFHPSDVISVTWVSPSGQRTTSSLHLTAGPPQ